MTVTALSSESASLPAGGLWEVSVIVRDADGYLSDVVPTLTVTPPDGTPDTPVAMTLVAAGVYRTLVTASDVGYYLARAEATGLGVADFAAFVIEPSAGAGAVTIADLTGPGGYMQVSSWDDASIEDALAAEAQAQRDVCDVPAAYPLSLRQALLRRVVRNLAMRGLPLAVPIGDAEAGDTVLPPGNDPEVRRLERPWRKAVMG